MGDEPLTAAPAVKPRQAVASADRLVLEERASVLTHALGVIASVAVTTLLLISSARRGGAWEIVGAAIFVATLIGLYLASTLYHAARNPLLRARLMVVDHCAIYLLIAGSYTPFMLNDLRGGWGWSLFGVIWGLAVAGTVFKLFFAGRWRLLSTGIYVAMGWLAIIAIGPMVRQLPSATLAWLIAGGIAYTAGTPFYHFQRIKYGHAIWHLFVLAGSACHAMAVATQL